MSTEFLAGETLPAGKLQTLGTPIVPYTPTLDATVTSPDLGSLGAQEGAWTRNNDRCVGWLSIMFGSGGSAGAGTYLVGLPFPLLDVGLSQLACGYGFLADASDGTAAGRRLVVASIIPSDVNAARLVVEGGRAVEATSPWTWAQGDRIHLAFDYPAQFS